MLRATFVMLRHTLTVLFGLIPNTVKFVKPEAYIQHNQESFADVEEVCNFARQMAHNCHLREQQVKRQRSNNRSMPAFVRVNEINPEDFDCDANLLRLWSLVKSIKDDCLFLCRN
jgi:hypothetical protein